MVRFGLMAALAGASATAPKIYDEPVEILFKEFLRKFEKNYSKEEWQKRKEIFAENVGYINVENGKGTNSYTLGIGPFADLKLEEFESILNLELTPDDQDGGVESPKLTAEDIKDIPSSVDWTKAGAVTEVKRQGGCGSCWSFSATGAIEGAFFIKTGELVSFSEQNLLDCNEKNGRCRGGSMNRAFRYMKAHGLCTEESYPYECRSRNSEACKDSLEHPKCQVCQSEIMPMEISKYVRVRRKSLLDLEAAVAQQPVSVGIHAGGKPFQHYQGGVIKGDSCELNLNHGVLAVGYGKEDGDDGLDYFYIKNSWGPYWGDNGYMRLQKSGPGVPEDGTCGLFKLSSYPVYTPLEPQEMDFVLEVEDDMEKRESEREIIF